MHIRQLRQKLICEILICTLIFVYAFNFGASKVNAALDNTNVINDYNFSNSAPMSADDINNFFIANGSKLANYVIPEYVDVPYPLASGGMTSVPARQVYEAVGGVFYGKTVAQLIYEECTAHNVNPRVVLVTLQKESSAITGDVFRSSTVAAWPMFYMYDETMANCLNTGIGCNDNYYRQISIDYGGIGQQIAYSTAWFGLKYAQYKSTGRPLKNSSNVVVGYEQYYDPININGSSLVCQTAGTRILYLYTPHYQSSFYNIFTGFFGAPDGSTPAPTPIPTATPTPTPNEVLERMNDTETYSLNTYDTVFKFNGTKSGLNRAYFREVNFADIGTTTWQLETNLEIGVNDLLVAYKRVDDSVINQKSFKIIRHKVGDINGDGVIDILDLSLMANNWGQTNPTEVMANLNPGVDNVVDILDLSLMANNWGQ